MVEMILLAAAASAESVSDALIDEHEALSVSVEDADAGTAAEQALFGEPGMPAAGSGLGALAVSRRSLRDEDQAARAATALLAQGDDTLRLASIEPVADQDWVRLTQAQFAPTAITPDFWVVPTLARAAGRSAPRHPPRSGHGLRHRHPSRPPACACAGSLAEAAGARSPWSRVLDYGCGSGHPRHRRGASRRAERSMPSTSTPMPSMPASPTPHANGVVAELRACRISLQAPMGWSWRTSWPRR